VSYCAVLLCCTDNVNKLHHISHSLQVCYPAYLVPVLSQDKLGGLQQEGHPM